MNMTLGELYDRYGNNMYQYLVIRLGSIQDAEDVLQETFCRFARYSVRWKLVRNPKTFIFGSIRNEANRFLKRRIDGRQPGPMNPDMIRAVASIIEGPDEKSESLLAEYLFRLPEEQREIITLKVFEGLTFQEIASVCGCSINTAASRYRYGLARLRSMLEEKQ